MHDWIYQVQHAEGISFALLSAVFLLGLLASLTSCCTVPVLTAVASYSGSISIHQKSRQVIISSLSFLLGTIISLAIIGALMGYVSSLLIKSMGMYWKIAAGLLVIFFGLMTLDLLPFRIPSVPVMKRKEGNGVFSSFVFGFAIGGLSTACNACCNPLFPVVMGTAFLKSGFLWGMSILLDFALGYGLPLTIAMIGIGIGFGTMSSKLSWLGKVVKYVAGIALVAIGFYLLFSI